MSKFSVRLRGLEWKNVREFEDIKIDLDRDKTNLLQIQNGYGKTTTLYLLRSVFTGQFPDEDFWESYRYKRKEGGSRSNSEFWAKLEIDGKDYEIGLLFKHEGQGESYSGEAEFITVSSELGGRVKGWEPPRTFRAKFEKKPNLVDLFVLDGEVAKELNKETGADRIEQAIRQVADLETLFDLVRTPTSDTTLGDLEAAQGKLSQILEKHLEFKGKRKITDPDQAFAKAVSAKDALDKQVKKTKKELKKLLVEQAELVETQRESVEELDAIDKGQGDIRPLMDAASQRKASAERNLAGATEKLYHALFNPSEIKGTIWQDVRNFHSGVEKGKIPQQLGKGLLIEFMEQEYCLCGSEWTDKMREHIDQNMHRYLGDEVLTAVKSMQQNVRETKPEVDLIALKEEISRVQDTIREADEELGILRARFDSKASERRESLLETNKATAIHLQEVDDDIREIKEEDWDKIIDEDWSRGALRSDGKTPLLQPRRFKGCKNLKCLEKIRNELNKRLTEAEGKLDIYYGVEFTRAVLTKALDKLMVKLREQVIRDANKILDKMQLASGGGIQLHGLNDGLKFKNEHGDIQDSSNMAVQLAGSYSYITAMYELGEIGVPLIVDSPLAGFGLGAAREWAKTVPPRFEQLTTFINSSEKNQLKQFTHDNADKIYVCTFRRANEKLNGKPQTGRMIVEEDREFFDEYEVVGDDPEEEESK